MKPNIQVWKIEKLTPYENNVKKHVPEQIEKIAASIKQFGWTQPIVVDKNGVIIAGHGRRLAAIKLEIKEVPVWVRDDMTDMQVRAARLSDNRVAVGDIDTEMFRAELADLDYNLDQIFDTKELDFASVDLGEMNTGAFIADVGGAVDEQEAATHGMVKELDNRRVPLMKAFGFKDVLGSDEIYIARFMAQVEVQSGLKGEAALVSFIKGLIGDLSHA